MEKKKKNFRNDFYLSHPQSVVQGRGALRLLLQLPNKETLPNPKKCNSSVHIAKGAKGRVWSQVKKEEGAVERIPRGGRWGAPWFEWRGSVGEQLVEYVTSVRP